MEKVSPHSRVYVACVVSFSSTLCPGALLCRVGALTRQHSPLPGTCTAGANDPFLLSVAPGTLRNLALPLLPPHLPLLLAFISAPGPLHLFFSLSHMFFLFQGFVVVFFSLPSFTLVFSHLVREATISKIHGASPFTPYPLTFFLILLQPPPRVTLCVPVLCAPEGIVHGRQQACPRVPWVCEPPQHLQHIPDSWS